jgi:hypothetical protein
MKRSSKLMLFGLGLFLLAGFWWTHPEGFASITGHDVCTNNQATC